MRTKATAASHAQVYSFQHLGHHGWLSHMTIVILPSWQPSPSSSLRHSDHRNHGMALFAPLVGTGSRKARSQIRLSIFPKCYNMLQYCYGIYIYIYAVYVRWYWFQFNIPNKTHGFCFPTPRSLLQLHPAPYCVGSGLSVWAGPWCDSRLENTTFKSPKKTEPVGS